MDVLKTFDYLVLARERLFGWVRPLGDEAWRREFPIGLKSVGRTLTHIMGCEWVYAERLRGRKEFPPYEEWEIQDERPPAFGVIEARWREQSAGTRRTLAEVLASGGWEKEIEFRPIWSDDRTEVIVATPGEVFLQMVVHEVHHRSQAMAMLRQLGVEAQDLDPAYLVYRRRKG